MLSQSQKFPIRRCVSSCHTWFPFRLSRTSNNNQAIYSMYKWLLLAFFLVALGNSMINWQMEWKDHTIRVFMLVFADVPRPTTSGGRKRATMAKIWWSTLYATRITNEIINHCRRLRKYRRMFLCCCCFSSRHLFCALCNNGFDVATLIIAFIVSN